MWAKAHITICDPQLFCWNDSRAGREFLEQEKQAGAPTIPRMHL